MVSLTDFATSSSKFFLSSSESCGRLRKPLEEAEIAESINEADEEVSPNETVEIIDAIVAKAITLMTSDIEVNILLPLVSLWSLRDPHVNL